MTARRDVLKQIAACALAACLPIHLFAEDFWSEPRELWLVRHETGEQMRAVYWADGGLDVTGFSQICHVLRDVRANQTVQMQLTLLDIMRAIQGWLEMNGFAQPIMVNSGYRTHETNALLRREGAARNSMHLYGRAADIWIPGVPPSYLARLALHLQSGGVGFYPSKGFVHIDTGRIRTWRG